jgi:thermostable 8-oxoguanine DNA glycosylase
VQDLLKVMNSLKALDERRDDIYLTLDRIEEVLKTYERRYDKKKEQEMKKCMKLMDDNKTITFVAAKV